MEVYKNLSLENLPDEEWRFIPNTDNIYMISNMGRIKSLDTFRVYPNYTRTCKSRIIKQFPNWQGYLSCNLSDSKGNKIRVSVHKMVCDVFIPNPQKLPCVNHKDENKQNNCYTNLEHCTYSYNLTYGSRAGEKDIPVLQYDLNGNFIKEYKSVISASKETNISTTSISNNTHGWSKSAGGFLWINKKENSPSLLEKYKDNNKTEVLCFNLDGELLKEYESLTKASKDLGIAYQSISACCRGKIKKVKNYIFKYK